MSGLRIFRDLPGIAEITPALEMSYGQLVPELQRQVDELSEDLFGITAAETQFAWRDWIATDDAWMREALAKEPGVIVTEARRKHLWTQAPGAVAERDWEMKFTLIHCDYDEAEQVWTALGWDVSDGEGDEHPAIEYLGRQLISAIHGHAGRLPDEDVVVRLLTADWEERIAMERDAFLDGKQKADPRFTPSKFEPKPRRPRRT